MAGKLILKGLDAYNGEYETPAAGSWTAREFNYIKQVSGVRAGELNAALAAGDMAAIVAVAAVTLQRHGVPDVNLEVLWEMTEENFEAVQDEGDEGRPPESATSGGQQNRAAAVAKPNDLTEPSGETGLETGESNPRTPLATGAPGSVPSVDSARAI